MPELIKGAVPTRLAFKPRLAIVWPTYALATTGPKLPAAEEPNVIPIDLWG